MSTKWLIRIIFVVLALQFMYFLGPQPSFDQSIAFKVGDLGSNLDRYLQEREGQFDDIRPGAQKRIDWAENQGQPTDISLIYVHGFSASAGEISPVVETVATSLGANVFYTRLQGHGRSGEAMGAATMHGWVNDVAEAVTIGAAIGQKTYIIGTSMGGTLATWAAAHTAFGPDLDGVILISPSYEVQAVPTFLLTMPWGRNIVELVSGPVRGNQCDTEASDAANSPWTGCYPTSALMPLGAIMASVEEVDKAKIRQPALFIYSSEDQVVAPQAIERVLKAWGGDTDKMVLSETGDEGNHVITGAIRSPETIDDVVDKIKTWISAR